MFVHDWVHYLPWVLGVTDSYLALQLRRLTDVTITNVPIESCVIPAQLPVTSLLAFYQLHITKTFCWHFAVDTCLNVAEDRFHSIVEHFWMQQEVIARINLFSQCPFNPEPYVASIFWVAEVLNCFCCRNLSVVTDRHCQFGAVCENHTSNKIPIYWINFAIRIDLSDLRMQWQAWRNYQELRRNYEWSGWLRVCSGPGEWVCVISGDDREEVHQAGNRPHYGISLPGFAAFPLGSRGMVEQRNVQLRLQEHSEYTSPLWHWVEYAETHPNLYLAFVSKKCVLSSNFEEEKTVWCLHLLWSTTSLPALALDVTFRSKHPVNCWIFLVMDSSFFNKQDCRRAMVPNDTVSEVLFINFGTKACLPAACYLSLCLHETLFMLD